MPNNETTNKTRYIIYVDATCMENNSKFKISLYDINKHDIQNAMILCDNQSAVQDKTIIFLSKLYNIKIIWIPREINTIADKVVKLEPTQKQSDLNLLDMFIKLASKICTNINTNNLEQKISELENTITTRNKKIQHHLKKTRHQFK